ncbi:MAG: calcium/proton exchanger [Euryarchaeota archaeon]|nr:calcium/proton exchanger [Euryarchaeota archaeon]|tara:strand:- start:1646 stop:2785 length:1140 start_codon:yes stop_codon:yes gene_type:complete
MSLVEQNTSPEGWKTFVDPRKSKLLFLLLAIPISIYFEFISHNYNGVFFASLFAIMPLAWLMGRATEEISLRVGQGLGAFLNASFGNAAELIIVIFLLIGATNASSLESATNLITVVQASLIGSILGNLLLVLGLAFVWGGIKHKEQKFSSDAVSTNGSLLMLAMLALIIPATFGQIENQSSDSILNLSRVAALILLMLYLLFLLFQLKTHSYLFINSAHHHEDEEALLTMKQAVLLLIISTILVAVMAEFLVGSIEHSAESLGWPPVFIGVILIPLFGNAAEHFTAVTVAGKNKMDLSIGIAIGSSTQVAVFIAPIAVILGWILNVEMTLEFGLFETIATFLAVLIANSICSDGKSNWLEGSLLLGTYAILAVSFWLA